MPPRCPARLLAPLTLLAAQLLAAASVAQEGSTRPAGGRDAETESPGRRWSQGPWGRLEITALRLRLPSELVPERPLPLRAWDLGDSSPGEARRILEKAGLPAEQVDALLEGLRIGRTTQLRPPPELLARIPAGHRQRLYARLRAFEGNDDQRTPHRFYADRLDQRFGGLRPETRALLERFLYTRPEAPGRVFLSDLPALTWLVPDPAERQALVQAVSERDSLLLRLHVNGDSDIEALLRYWDVGQRRRDLEPLLRSAAAVPGGYGLDVVQLLPRFARLFVFTYPPPGSAAGRDCFWTAVSFLEDTPPPPEDGAALQEALRRGYAPARGAPRLGDVLLLERQDGELIHAAVYVADDVFFTRNGDHFSVPWLLMRRDDMLELYADLDAARTSYWRRRSATAADPRP